MNEQSWASIEAHSWKTNSSFVKSRDKGTLKKFNLIIIIRRLGIDSEWQVLLDFKREDSCHLPFRINSFQVQ